MALTDWIKSIINKRSQDKELAPLNPSSISFKVVVVEFYDNVENNYGETVAKLLSQKQGMDVIYYNEPFPKAFLKLETRSFFDMIDKGQELLEKFDAEALIWGYRENKKIRLNFQSDKQYEADENTFVSLMDSLYIPVDLIDTQSLPSSLSNLVYGATVSTIRPQNKEKQIQKRYLLKKIIDVLSKDNSTKILSIEYMPYVMNFLGIIYLNYAFDNKDDRDFKIIKNLFNAALKHQDLITSPIHLGCIYNHLGQLYGCATKNIEKKPLSYFKGALTFYNQAQKFLSKYNYPYDYGHISYKLSHLLFCYWRQKEDIQALRDSVSQLREAEKIYTYALFPEFWAVIQGDLGRSLSLLGSVTKSDEICELAIAAYKNQQKIITEKRDPLTWAKVQESIGSIYYSQGKKDSDKASLEEALEYFHDALYIFENMKLDNDVRTITINISKTSQALNGF